MISARRLAGRVALLLVAAGMALMPWPPAARAHHGGPHPGAPSVFPRLVDPWSHWGRPSHQPPATRGHGFRHPRGTVKPHGFKGSVIVAPAPRAAWVQPHWAWNGFGWVWVPGHWVRW